jgi:hypothetical protein
MHANVKSTVHGPQVVRIVTLLKLRSSSRLFFGIKETVKIFFKCLKRESCDIFVRVKHDCLKEGQFDLLFFILREVLHSKFVGSYQNSMTVSKDFQRKNCIKIEFSHAF